MDNKRLNIFHSLHNSSVERFQKAEAGCLIVSEIVPRSCPGPDLRVNVCFTKFLEYS